MPITLLRHLPVWSVVWSVAWSAVGATLHAQRPAPTLAQLAPRAWTTLDGAPAPVVALAQSSDGLLWIGSSTTGLHRFDGVRFEEFEPGEGQSLPTRGVSALLSVPDGSLWIGFLYGGASVPAGNRLVHYGEREGLPPSTVMAFARESAGDMWAATTTGLLRRAGGRWHRVGAESGYPGGLTSELLVDRRGALWATELTGVYVLPRGARRFVRRAPSLDVRGSGGGSAGEAPDGSVWGASASRGLARLSDPVGRPPPVPAAVRGPDTNAWGLLVDRGANAWLFGDWDRLVRIPLARPFDGTAPPHPGVRQTRSFSRAVGMSGDRAYVLFEDREGSVWVGTDGGLDQFRAPRFTPVVWPRPVVLPAIAADDAGAVWAGSASGPLVALGDRTVAQPEVSAPITCAYRDLEGGVWLGGPPGIWYARGGRLDRITVPAEAARREVQAIARGRDGTLWLSVPTRPGEGAVFRRRGRVWARLRARPGLDEALAFALVADGAGRTWLGYTRDRLALVAADSVRVFTAADGLRVGNVTAIHVRGDRVWVGGSFGVAVLDAAARGGRFEPLAVEGGGPRSVSGIVETADGALWVRGAGGLTRVPPVEVRRARRDRGYRAREERYDTRDGIGAAAPEIRPSPSLIEGTDGRLWVTSRHGVSWVHPLRIERNPLAPPVHVRALESGGRRYGTGRGRVTLPERTTSLNIAYTATSLAVPERVRFRYRLLGLDTAWQDAGGRREAFYTNLGPGAYRFQVVAANDDGVWNKRGATLDVVVPPAFVQTTAFLALCAAAAAGAAWRLAAWRHRRVADAIRTRFDATLAERSRVARELHDTLLSGVAGMAMQLDAVAARSRSAAGLDVTALDELRGQARHTLFDARRAVVMMRGAGDAAGPVSAQLADAARRIFAGTDVDARVTCAGAPRRYPLELEEQVVRVAIEAMTNARKHAGCRALRVTCAYGQRELSVLVRDDGRGFDPTQAGPNGHFGLVGMHERAAAVGARLSVESAPGQGTTVRLVAPLPALH